ncbi:MAG: biotin/lipoyl-binding protein, partial [Xanthomonadales bacterium]|nr:biotin/lipoyl-binding protein [Xanthomonadales bacterium]
MIKIADTSGQDVAISEAPSWQKYWPLGAGVLVLLLAAWLLLPSLQRWASSSVTVPLDRLRLATVERGSLVRDASVQGRVVAAVSPTLFAPADGNISLQVDAGAEVLEGQVLAVLESPELQNRLQQEQATLDQLRVELQRQSIEAKQKSLDNRREIDEAKVTLVAAERERRRAESGFEIEAISQIDFEKTKD